MKCTTLKELKKEEQLIIDEYQSLNSQHGLNCVRAYRCPELTYDYEQRLISDTSKHKSELCYDNSIPIQLIQHIKTFKPSIKTTKLVLL